MKRFATIAAIVLVGLAATILAWRAFGSRAQAARLDGVVAWARQQSVASGTVASVMLPPNLAAGSSQSVSIAQLKDGRRCFLLVTEVGWKDNFRGVLWCSGPLARAEIYTPDDNRAPYVTLPGYGVFEELYIAKKRSDNAYDVYFDLN